MAPPAAAGQRLAADRSAPDRSPAERVTADRVIAAADAIAARHGIHGITIQRLCDELGVSPPTIYWHIGNKASLIDALVDRIVERIEPPQPADGDGWSRLYDFFVDVHRVVSRYPGLGAHLAAQPAGRGGLDHAVAIVDGLRAEGLSDEDALRAFYVALVHVGGHQLYSEAMRSTPAGEPAVRPFDEAVADLVEAVPDEAPYSPLRRYAAGFDDAASQRMFEWGLGRLIDGMRAAH